MSNFFSSDWFQAAVCRVLLADQAARPGVVQVQDQHFDVPVTRSGRVVRIPFVDFLEARTEPARPSHRARYLPRVCLGMVPVGPDGPPPEAAGALGAPRVDWSRFPSWEAFVGHARGRNSRAFGKSARKERKLAQEVGPLRYALDLPDHALLERCLLWKSRQLRRSRRADWFASPRVRQFLHHLLDEGRLQLSALQAGDQTLAIHLSCPWERRYACWVVSFDPDHSRYSPGVLLFERLMRETYEQGYAEFDFLAGDETYKYYYATDARLVGPLGRPPAWDHVAGRARRVAFDEDLPYPRVRQRARDLGSQLLQAHLERQAPSRDPGLRGPWLDLVEQNARDWPRSRLEHPEDCQLVRFLALAEARTGKLEAARIWGSYQGRRARSFTRRRLRALRAPPDAAPAASEPLGLRAGEWVRVKDPAAIAATLRDGKQGGLLYLPPVMDRFAGRTFRVHRPVARFYDEAKQRVVRVRDTVVLEGVHCDGSQIFDGKGCDRGCLVFWKEAWLERVEAPTEVARPDAGQRVRVRPWAELARGPGDHPVQAVERWMALLAGREFVVLQRVERAYDERRGCVVPVCGAVVLKGVHCSGAPLTGGGWCDRACLLLFRDAWLEPVQSDSA